MRSKKRGEDFLRKIEKLKENLQLQGISIQNMRSELSQERANLLQSEKLTPQQRAAQEKLKKANVKRQEELEKPKVSNYNELRMRDRDAPIDISFPARNSSEDRSHPTNEEADDIPQRARTAVGANSNIRRAAGGQFIGRGPLKKIADEIRL